MSTLSRLALLIVVLTDFDTVSIRNNNIGRWASTKLMPINPIYKQWHYIKNIPLKGSCVAARPYFVVASIFQE